MPEKFPRKRLSVRRRLLLALGLVFVVDCVWVLGLGVWSSTVVGQPQASHADAIAVLYADFGPTLNRSLRSLDQAQRLHTRLPTAKLLCIGGNRLTTRQRWGEAMADHLLRIGVPAALIVKDFESNDTRTNVRAIVDLLTKDQLRTVLIIAHPAHAPRVLHHWRQAAKTEHGIIVLPVEPEHMFERLRDFWIMAQHEALAWIGMLLPNAVQNRIISWIRR